MTRGTSQRAPCALQDSHSRSQWRLADLKWDLIQFDNPFWNRWGSEPRNRNNLMAEDGDTTWCFSVPFVMCEINPVELVWFMSRWYKSFFCFFLQITIRLIPAPAPSLAGLSSTGPLEWTGPPPEAWCSLWPVREKPRLQPLSSGRGWTVATTT